MPSSDFGYQLPLFDLPVATDHVVNVASVPQRSPFRYPGGKTWLVPQIRRWLGSLDWKPEIFLEPFAGGAVVGLTVAFEKLAGKIILVELDEQVAAVWKTILGSDCEWLIQRILCFEITVENVQSELVHKTTSTKKRAFRTILKNRTYHGGILAPGSGLIKNGENGKGISSRWYPETLARRIGAIAGISDRIQFIEGDGIEAVRKFAQNKRAAMFIDPPYTAAGKKAGTRLYTHYEINHDGLFSEASQAKGDVLLTYDNAPEVAEMAKRHGFKTCAIAMKNTHNTKMTELLIGKNMDWIK